MAKKITKKLKLVIPAGKATPAPPVGPALGQAGINIGDFVTKFNAATAKMAGDIVPVEIVVYEDRTYDLFLKTPPAASLVLKAIGAEIGKISKAQIKEIAEKKMVDLNAKDIEGAMRIIEGTCRSMGVEIK